MLRFSPFRFASTNASGRAAVERQFGKRNPVARFSAKMAEKLAKRRKVDDLADYVDQDLRFEFTSSFEYAMGGFTLLIMALPMYLVCEGWTPPSKVTVWVGMMTEKEYNETWEMMTNKWGIPWWTSSIGHAALFFVLYQFTPYIRYPFYVHVMAPFYRKMGWVTNRFHAKQKAAELTKMTNNTAGVNIKSGKKSGWHGGGAGGV